MNNEILAAQLVQSLSFQVEAIPQDKVLQVKSTGNMTPLNVKIKVRKKDEAGIVHRGFISVPKFGEPDSAPERIKLASSDQTIMSFNVLMEADFERKAVKKPRKNFFSSCLGTQGDDDDDDVPYLPSDKASVSRSASEILKGKRVLLKNTSDDIGCSRPIRKRSRGIFGKCKPGGCLDPPFNEDKHPYEPNSAKRTIAKGKEKDKNLNKQDVKNIFFNKEETQNMPSDKMLHQKEKKSSDNPINATKTIKEDYPKSSIFSLYEGEPRTNHLEEDDLNSIITYPPAIVSSGLNLNGEISSKTDNYRTSNSSKSRKSFEFTATYFIPPKKDSVKDTTSLRKGSKEMDVKKGYVRKQKIGSEYKKYSYDNNVKSNNKNKTLANIVPTKIQPFVRSIEDEKATDSKPIRKNKNDTEPQTLKATYPIEDAHQFAKDDTNTDTNDKNTKKTSKESFIKKSRKTSSPGKIQDDNNTDPILKMKLKAPLSEEKPIVKSTIKNLKNELSSSTNLKDIYQNKPLKLVKNENEKGLIKKLSSSDYKSPFYIPNKPNLRDKDENLIEKRKFAPVDYLKIDPGLDHDKINAEISCNINKTNIIQLVTRDDSLKDSSRVNKNDTPQIQHKNIEPTTEKDPSYPHIQQISGSAKVLTYESGALENNLPALKTSLIVDNFTKPVSKDLSLKKKSNDNSILSDVKNIKIGSGVPNNFNEDVIKKEKPTQDAISIVVVDNDIIKRKDAMSSNGIQSDCLINTSAQIGNTVQQAFSKFKDDENISKINVTISDDVDGGNVLDMSAIVVDTPQSAISNIVDDDISKEKVMVSDNIESSKLIDMVVIVRNTPQQAIPKNTVDKDLSEGKITDLLSNENESDKLINTSTIVGNTAQKPIQKKRIGDDISKGNIIISDAIKTNEPIDTNAIVQNSPQKSILKIIVNDDISKETEMLSDEISSRKLVEASTVVENILQQNFSKTTLNENISKSRVILADDIESGTIALDMVTKVEITIPEAFSEAAIIKDHFREEKGVISLPDVFEKFKPKDTRISNEISAQDVIPEAEIGHDKAHKKGIRYLLDKRKRSKSVDINKIVENTAKDVDQKAKAEKHITKDKVIIFSKDESKNSKPEDNDIMDGRPYLNNIKDSSIIYKEHSTKESIVPENLLSNTPGSNMDQVSVPIIFLGIKLETPDNIQKDNLISEEKLKLRSQNYTNSMDTFTDFKESSKVASALKTELPTTVNDISKNILNEKLNQTTVSDKVFYMPKKEIIDKVDTIVSNVSTDLENSSMDIQDNEERKYVHEENLTNTVKVKDHFNKSLDRTQSVAETDSDKKSIGNLDKSHLTTTENFTIMPQHHHVPDRLVKNSFIGTPITKVHILPKGSLDHAQSLKNNYDGTSLSERSPQLDQINEIYSDIKKKTTKVMGGQIIHSINDSFKEDKTNIRAHTYEENVLMEPDILSSADAKSQDLYIEEQHLRKQNIHKIRTSVRDNGVVLNQELRLERELIRDNSSKKENENLSADTKKVISKNNINQKQHNSSNGASADLKYNTDQYDENIKPIPINQFIYKKEKQQPISPYKIVERTDNYKPKRLLAQLDENIVNRNSNGQGASNSSNLSMEKLTPKTTSNISLANNSIVVDLAFLSFSNKNNERVIKTLDTVYPKGIDNIVVVKSRLRPQSKEIRVPLDRENDVSIQIKKALIKPRRSIKMKTRISLGETFKRKLMQQGSSMTSKLAVSGNEKVLEPSIKLSYTRIASEILHESLSTIYEQELIPLHEIIKSLKEEIDVLAGEQIVFKDKLQGVAKMRPICRPRLVHISKRCGCLRK